MTVRLAMFVVRTMSYNITSQRNVDNKYANTDLLDNIYWRTHKHIDDRIKHDATSASVLNDEDSCGDDELKTYSHAIVAIYHKYVFIVIATQQ